MTTSRCADASKSRVLVADDHPVVREGLRRILTDAEDMTVAAEASDGQQVLERIREQTFDVVLLDLTMPGRNGLEILTQLRAERPDLPVLILSVHAEDQYASRVIQLGASGYLTKDAAPTALIDALRRVLSGHIYVSPAFAEQLVRELQLPREKHRYETLSTREFEVMLMLASGRSLTQIASELFLSIKTISTYRTRILQKLGVTSNAEIVKYVLQNRLAD